MLVSAIARMSIDNQITVSNWLLSEVSESAQAVALGISEKPLEDLRPPEVHAVSCLSLLCTFGRHCLKVQRCSWLVDPQRLSFLCIPVAGGSLSTLNRDSQLNSYSICILVRKNKLPCQSSLSQGGGWPDSLRRSSWMPLSLPLDIADSLNVIVHSAFVESNRCSKWKRDK